MPVDLDELVRNGLAGQSASRQQAMEALQCSDDNLLWLLAAAGTVRRHFFGNRVKVNYLVNLKSGLCPEDCSYCSQRRGSTADVPTYSWLSHDDAVSQAVLGAQAGASRVCLVSSGRGPADRDVDRVAGMVRSVKGRRPELEVCVCLGLLQDGQAERLRDAGVDAYNHNLNTAAGRYPEICSTHTYPDRVDTVARAHAAGLSACSGFIAGLGESDEDLVELAFALREQGAESIPVNFLMPFEGTPVAGQASLNPRRCLRILTMVRLVCPDREVRVAAGRELHLRGLQAMALHVANSIFLGDYLTSEGQSVRDDLSLIRDAGFVVEGDASGGLAVAADATPGDRGHPCGREEADGASCSGTCSEAGRQHSALDVTETGSVQVPVRRRGPGTPLPANA